MEKSSVLLPNKNQMKNVLNSVVISFWSWFVIMIDDVSSSI